MLSKEQISNILSKDSVKKPTKEIVAESTLVLCTYMAIIEGKKKNYSVKKIIEYVYSSLSMMDDSQGLAKLFKDVGFRKSYAEILSKILNPNTSEEEVAVASKIIKKENNKKDILEKLSKAKSVI